VEKNYCGLETAFKASFSNGAGRTFAFNSEYDALPGVGHACGHNLIAVAGLAAALGVRAAMQARDVKGSVVLIGTPAVSEVDWCRVLTSRKKAG
jgi:metal-dependent amidase/aminoacylase/carboxypeptidase family protein